MIVEEIQTPQTSLVPTIPSYKFFVGTGTTRSMGIVIYFKETWVGEC